MKIVLNSPLQSVIDMYRIKAPKVYQDDDITPEVSKHFCDDSKYRKYVIVCNTGQDREAPQCSGEGAGEPVFVFVDDHETFHFLHFITEDVHQLLHELGVSLILRSDDILPDLDRIFQHLEARRVDHSNVWTKRVSQELSGAEGRHLCLRLEAVAHSEGKLQPVLFLLPDLRQVVEAEQTVGDAGFADPLLAQHDKPRPGQITFKYHFIKVLPPSHSIILLPLL